MHLAFTEDQRLFRDSVRALLQKECGPGRVRASWASETGRSPELWAMLADLGVLGLTVPEAHGGLGRDEVDLVPVLEEAGRAALPEPLLETVAIGAPLIAEDGSEALQAAILPAVVAGEARLAVGLSMTPFVADAHVATWLLLQHGDAVHAVPRAEVRLVREASIDGARRLFRVAWTPGAATLVADGEAGRRAVDRAFARGALATSAVLLGLARQMLSMTVAYAKVRQQFGKPIGSFQAVKHLLVDALSKIEFAAPVVYRAAYSLAHGSEMRDVHVAMAKAYASDAAELAARVSLQVHGAVGYTVEHDLHLWMKRAWALSAAWGDSAFHRAHVAARVLDRPTA